MASLFPGYNYDVFISYRQKDNKHDGWVTDFVNHLTGELESTFKEEISVYFDNDPHHGLLEMHDVDDSLREKLKCLIFIPVISRTYCDPKSFAWEYEFNTFNEMASTDQFGMKVRLPNGNIVSRILPVRIHDLDPDDIKTLELATGGVLRGIEFIYREPGVNRPLTSSDDEKQNLNRTLYRNQVNKLALTISEIINALRHHKDHPEISEKGKEAGNKIREIKNTKWYVALAAVAVILLVTAILFVTNIKDNVLERSIAVLPVYSDTQGDHADFLNGLIADITDNLQNIKGINVPSRTSSSQFEYNSGLSIREVGKRLNVNYIIEVSGLKNGETLVSSIHLYEARNDKHLWGNKFSRIIKDVADYEQISATVLNGIADVLDITISPEERKLIEVVPTKNLDALINYRQGIYYFWRAGETGETDRSIELFRNAIRYDPNFALAYTGIANAYLDQYFFYKDRSEDVLVKSRQAIDSAFRISPDLPEAHLALGNYYYMRLKYKEALDEFNPVLEARPDDPEANFWTACVYRRAGDWEKAKSLFTRAVKLDPGKAEFIIDLAQTYTYLRLYDSAEFYYRNAISLRPDWLFTYAAYSDMLLSSTGDPAKAESAITAASSIEGFLDYKFLVELRYRLDIMKGDFNAALNDLRFMEDTGFWSQEMYKPKQLFFAEIYDRMGMKDMAKAYYDSSRVILEKLAEKWPEDHRCITSLGYVYAGLGKKEQAIQMGKKAVAILSPDKEALRGLYTVENLMRIYIMTGYREEAIELLKYVLSIPGLITPQLLKSDPLYAPLKSNPEFLKLAATG